MSDGRVEFENRVDRLWRRHEALSRGCRAILRPDGLIVLKPRRFAFKLPIPGFVLLMGMLMAFKGFMLASLGEAGYGARLTTLDAGTVFDRMGALVMGLDPVSKVLGDMLARFL